MTLEELSLQYRETADLVYRRVRELRAQELTLPASQRRSLQRQIRIMLRMYRDLSSMATHLKKYYDRSYARDERYTL